MAEAILFAGDEDRTGLDVPPRNPLLAKDPLRLLGPAASVPLT